MNYVHVDFILNGTFRATYKAVSRNSNGTWNFQEQATPYMTSAPVYASAGGAGGAFCSGGSMYSASYDNYNYSVTTNGTTNNYSMSVLSGYTLYSPMCN
jgi:hypothetical protein